jgi:uncharacterized protein GlcG (DUF336 family)
VTIAGRKGNKGLQPAKRRYPPVPGRALAPAISSFVSSERKTSRVAELERLTDDGKATCTTSPGYAMASRMVMRRRTTSELEIGMAPEARVQNGGARFSGLVCQFLLPIGRTAIAASFLTGSIAGFGVPASAQVSQSGYVLPMKLALEAAEEAVESCAAKGFDVTVTVVDVSGTPKVVLRGDHATIHTKDSSYRKAYTIVTMGPIFRVNVTSQFLEVLSKYPPLAGQALASTPNVSALPGGAAIMAHDEIVAGIGVGGSPGGDKDEACAKAGVAKIQDQLPH